ncbi:penicillin-binding protein activator [Pseudooctadecabacter sp.]|uniref:penicillin-binding protein activator n=1 Tax=Pseudooctadecabacter sp. TaxID=1966338 RepID=UPI0035C792E4
MLARLPSLPQLMIRRTAARIFAVMSLAFLAACDLAVPAVGGGGQGQTIDPSAPVQVALLVPGGTGQAEFDQIARSLEDSARLAIADLNGADVNLRVYNTARNAGQASQMAGQAIADGAQIILGPLDAESANAVGLVASGANVNVLAFSNNTAVAGGNVFVLGNTFGNISDRLVDYAGRRGITQFMIAHQDDLAGAVGRDAIATSVRSAGGTVVGIQSYPFNQAGIFASAPAIATAANTTGAQAVFTTDNMAGGLPILATSLAQSGLNTANTPLIGLTRWDAAPQAAELPSLQNGLFAMGDAGREAAFRNRYEATYGTRPHPLASIAYDGIAAIGALAASGDRNALTRGSLTRAAGFAGATGAFRLRPDGSKQRALAVATIVNNRISIVEAAPLSFGAGGS